MSVRGDSSATDLHPLRFQREVADYLENEEPALWAAYSDQGSLQQLASTTQLELLKYTVRLEATGHPRAYAAAREAAARLGVSSEVILYQGPEGRGSNAGLYFTPEVAHIVLYGPLLQSLDDAELRALLGHELAHHRLWTTENGRYFVADRLLDSNAQHGTAHVAAQITAERNQLYTELFADRGAAIAAQGIEPAIRLLLKTQTGLSDPDVAAYRKQVDDVMAGGLLASDGGTHPETFIRVRALDAWAAGDEELVDRMIRGPLQLETLDCLEQKKLEALTEAFVEFALQHGWLRTEAVLGQARLMLPELSIPSAPRKDTVQQVQKAGPALADYWCYLLLDLAAADRELDEMGILAGQLTAEEFELRERFENIANQELRITKKRLNELWEKRATLRLTAEQQAAAGESK